MSGMQKCLTCHAVWCLQLCELATCSFSLLKMVLDPLIKVCKRVTSYDDVSGRDADCPVCLHRKLRFDQKERG